MASTPSNRLKLTPSNSPFLPRPARSPIRGRPAPDVSPLSLRRVVGTTCSSPTGFDTVQSSFAYIAGGAVVVVDVQGEKYAQRFFRARPAAVPVFSTSPVPQAPSTPNSTPKANDSRNRVAPGGGHRDSFASDWLDSPSSKTWTQRERIKAATCLSLSRDGRFLAVGETGYAPRVLIFGLHEGSSDVPVVSISEHTFGVTAVAWSADTKYLASLGAANDGFLYIWKVDPRTGAAKLFQQNRCTSYVRGMVWMGSNLVTFGVRHIKAWKVEESQSTSPSKQRFPGDGSFPVAQSQRPLPGRNILLGSLLEATFTCAAVIDDSMAIVCSETGDISLLDDTGKQMRLVRVTNVDFPVHCISTRNQTAYISGKAGQFATLDIGKLVECQPESVITTTESSEGLIALGFLGDHLVTIDSRKSIDIWQPEHTPAMMPDSSGPSLHIPIPGHSDAILGIQQLARPNTTDAAFFTWSGPGRVMLWGVDGNVKSSFDMAIEQTPSWSDAEPPNQLCAVAASRGGQLFAAADRLGVLRVMEFATKTCLLETKAHSSDCQVLAIFEGDSQKVLMASCGRDRTAQLFHRTSAEGTIEHFQTLEFAARVVQAIIPSEDKLITCSLDRTLQVHEIVSKDLEPDVIAAVPARVISLKASPSSMVMAPDEKSVYVSLLDRSVCQFDIATGRLLNSFKCMDQSGVESVVLDSLIYGRPTPGTSEPSFLLGISNTDKSVRMYDSQSGAFLDREWGHTEAINGVALVEDDQDDDQGSRKVVSVGSDGTIMVWALDWSDPAPLGGSISRDPSPAKEAKETVLTSSRQPLRRVLSKAELAEFQRPTTSAGRRSPPRTVSRRTSRYNLHGGSTPVLRTPVAAALQMSPAPASAASALIIAEDTPSRRGSSGSGTSGSPPPVSPKSRVSRRPSLPAMGTTPPTAGSGSRSGPRKKGSSTNLRSSTVTTSAYGFGSLNMSTEQACRTLRAYRKKLGTSSDPIRPDALSELDQELRLTAAAVADRAIRSKAMSESLLNGLLDQYSERLVSLLDAKLRLRDIEAAAEPDPSGPGDGCISSGGVDGESTASSPRQSAAEEAAQSASGGDDETIPALT